MSMVSLSRPGGGTTSILGGGGGFTVIGSAALTVPTPAPAGLFVGDIFAAAPFSLAVPTPGPTGAMPTNLFDPPQGLAATAPVASGGLAVDPDGASPTVTVTVSATPTFTVT